MHLGRRSRRGRGKPRSEDGVKFPKFVTIEVKGLSILPLKKHQRGWIPGFVLFVFFKCPPLAILYQLAPNLFSFLISLVPEINAWEPHAPPSSETVTDSNGPFFYFPQKI